MAIIEVFKDLSTDRTGRPTDIKCINVWISHRADVDGINPEQCCRDSKSRVATW
jgi:hypothetical protein